MQTLLIYNLEALAAAELLNSSDPTLLTGKEIREGWGSVTNFMISYGLKPYNKEDCEQARALSRAIKRGDDSEEN